MTEKFKQLFPSGPALIGMIHVPALPGTPNYQGSIQAILDQVMAECEIYLRAGVDGLMIENMHDVPYLKRQVGPEITAMMSTVGRMVKDRSQLPCGLQILAGANQAALAAALAGGLDFIRAEGFVYAHVADEGIIDSDAGNLLRYRKAIGAEHIAVWTDLKKKHSAHAITQDVSIQETAAAAAFFLSDGLIVTGTSTGQPASVADLAALREHTTLPLLVGSGISRSNVEDYLPFCDGLIVGSWFKENGYWGNALVYDRVVSLVEAVKKGNKKN